MFSRCPEDVCKMSWCLVGKFCQNLTETHYLNHNDYGNLCFLCVAIAFNFIIGVLLCSQARQVLLKGLCLLQNIFKIIL